MDHLLLYYKLQVTSEIRTRLNTQTCDKSMNKEHETRTAEGNKSFQNK